VYVMSTCTHPLVVVVVTINLSLVQTQISSSQLNSTHHLLGSVPFLAGGGAPGVPGVDRKLGRAGRWRGGGAELMLKTWTRVPQRGSESSGRAGRRSERGVVILSVIARGC